MFVFSLKCLHIPNSAGVTQENNLLQRRTKDIVTLCQYICLLPVVAAAPYYGTYSQIAYIFSLHADENHPCRGSSGSIHNIAQSSEASSLLTVGGVIQSLSRGVKPDLECDQYQGRLLVRLFRPIQYEGWSNISRSKRSLRFGSFNSTK